MDCFARLKCQQCGILPHEAELADRTLGQSTKYVKVNL